MPFNSIFSWYIKRRISKIVFFRDNPLETQSRVFKNLISNYSKTTYGKSHGLTPNSNYADFKEKIPLHTYETFKPFIDKHLNGQKDVIWPGKIKWFAKSSGTTSSRSKHIPVSKESLIECHYQGGKDLLSIYHNNFPNRKLFTKKHLILGGSSELISTNSSAILGDLSAIIVSNLPWWAESRRTPSRKTTLLSDWETKLDKMANETMREDVCILAGVPSWTLVLCNRVLEISGKKSLDQVWPNLELYMHGGVHFEPYKAEFERLIQNPKMNYVETYNASEGFFGLQDNPTSNDLLLLLDYGVFYEFIPMDCFQSTDSQTILTLEEIELGVNYALVISTNGGLCRYILGDTILFTSKKPFRFIITGRTQSFINAFGEELIVDNAEKAIAIACHHTNAQIREYTAGPIYLENNKKGGHEWYIEFKISPKDLNYFTETLDKEIRKLNSDYDAKRSGDLALLKPIIHSTPAGTFEKWFKSHDKLGGQNKIPRLSNNRKLLDEISNLLAQTDA